MPIDVKPTASVAKSGMKLFKTVVLPAFLALPIMLMI
jgi:hypothetical protein